MVYTVLPLRGRLKRQITIAEYREARRRARLATRWLREQPRGCIILHSLYSCEDVREAAMRAALRAVKGAGFARPGAVSYFIVSTLSPG